MNAAATNIVYVEYDFAADGGMGPWSAVEDKDGKLWIPYYGRGNKVVRLDPEYRRADAVPAALLRRTPQPASIRSFRLPTGRSGSPRSRPGRIGQLDPSTGKVTEHQNPPLPNGRRTTAHTVRVDEAGRVWASGGPAISMFDPKYERFTPLRPRRHLRQRGGAATAISGSPRSCEDGPIARVSKDGVLSKFYPPTKGKPQRLQVDADGTVWFTERRGGKIGHFDPKTETFKEYPLPGPEPSPYAIGIDRNHMIWYSSHEQDTLGRLDPRPAR